MIETTVLIAVVVMALVAMFSFMRNAVSHRVKGGSDAFGRGMLYDGTRQ